MAIKNKRNVVLELQASPTQRRTDEHSDHQIPDQEEIRRRAHEIYLERADRPGDELDDWLRAERELQKVALFNRGWNRFEEWHRTKYEEGN
jgi:hypothetical protein